MASSRTGCDRWPAGCPRPVPRGRRHLRKTPAMTPGPDPRRVTGAVVDRRGLRRLAIGRPFLWGFGPASSVIAASLSFSGRSPTVFAGHAAILAATAGPITILPRRRTYKLGPARRPPRRPSFRGLTTMIPRQEILEQCACSLDPCSLVLLLTASVGLAAPAQEKPNDATMGAKPPEGAIVLFDGKTWTAGSSATARRRPTGRWHDGIITVGHGDIMTQKRFGDFQLHLEFNVPYMPKAQRTGPRQQRRLPRRDPRASGSRLVRAQAQEQRLRRNLQADRPGGQRLQTAAPVADL